MYCFFLKKAPCIGLFKKKIHYVRDGFEICGAHEAMASVHAKEKL